MGKEENEEEVEDEKQKETRNDRSNVHTHSHKRHNSNLRHHARHQTKNCKRHQPHGKSDNRDTNFEHPIEEYEEWFDLLIPLQGKCESDDHREDDNPKHLPARCRSNG